jgi:chloride channel protein, CIC family
MSTLPGDSTIAGASTAPHARKTASERYHRPRRALGDAVLHAPQTLRALVRADEIWLVVLSAFVGAGAGIAVWLMTATTQLIHQLLFKIQAGERLSAMVELDPIRTLVVPTLGGLVLGCLGLAIVRYSSRRAVDPIEANALYGGRMSLNDSLIVVVQTIMSNGVGASVGLEAGYTQIGSALASRLGRMFRVRRNDLRLLRRGCRDRWRVQRPTDRRVLRVRAGHRHLFARHLRAGRRRFHRVRGDRQRLGWRAVRSRIAGADAG